MGIFIGYLISRWKVNVWNWDFCERLLFYDLKTREYEPSPSRGRTVFTSLTTKETFASGNYINKNTIQFSENISNSVFKMIQLYHVVDIKKKLNVSLSLQQLILAPLITASWKIWRVLLFSFVWKEYSPKF